MYSLRDNGVGTAGVQNVQHMACKWVESIGVANKNAAFSMLMGLLKDSKYNVASFFSTYESLRYLDVQIWQFLCRQTNRWTELK
jgi:hypothetical protein